MEVKVLVTGHSEIDRWFSLATDRMQRQLLKGATAAGGTTLAKQIRRNIARMAGTRTPEQRKGRPQLRRTIVKKYWSRPRAGIVAHVVGARYGRGGGPHSHLVEFGHRTSIGTHTRAIPFQKTAEKQARMAVFTAQQQYITKRFNKVMGK